YQEYDLAPLKLVFKFSIYNVWKSVQYGVSKELDTAYWAFLRARIRRFSKTGLLPSGCVDLTGDEDPTDKDGDIGMGDSTCVSTSLGGEIFSRGNKCRESNIGDSDNTGDGGKIVNGAIGSCGGIGERASKTKRSLVKSSEKLGEVFPGEAGK
ncbi:hypothetical protein Tco_0635868, partial [Tanacetum coccineum]